MKERRILTLLVPKLGNKWTNAVRAGFGRLASAVVLKDGMQDLTWYTDQNKAGPALQSLLDACPEMQVEEARRRGTLEQPDRRFSPPH